MSALVVPCVHAQETDSTLQARVEHAVHGPDGEGRDGPMAALDRTLISLYYEYRAYQQGQKDGSFSPSDEGLPVQNAHVTVDAIAKTTPAGLLDSLQALGLQNGAQAERLVSGRLPITALRKAAGLSLLQSMRAAQARTRTNTGGMLPAPPPDANMEDTTMAASSEPRPDSEADESPPDATSAEPDPSPDAPAPADTETTPESQAQDEGAPTSTSASDSKADSGAAEAAQTDASPQLPAPPEQERPDPRDGPSEHADGGPAPWDWIGYVAGGIVLLILGLLAVRKRGA